MLPLGEAAELTFVTLVSPMIILRSRMFAAC
jgi:hypothetical protein